MRVKRDIESSEVNFAAKHTLFVEGDHDSVDRNVLEALLEREIAVEGMGPSLHIRSVAKALHPFHPDYYFLIDRDHSSDEEVEATWLSFPNPDNHNLLIWRRRMIENYFIDPDFLAQSPRLKPKAMKQLSSKILGLCQKRLYLDLVKMVIIDIRETLKTSWITLPTNPELFPDAESARMFLLSHEALKMRATDTAQATSAAKIRELFDMKYHLLSNGKERLVYGEGDWIKHVDGKPVLNAIVHWGMHAGESDRDHLTSTVTELVKISKNLPQDFIELKKLIRRIISRS